MLVTQPAAPKSENGVVVHGKRTSGGTCWLHKSDEPKNKALVIMP